jgi:hypothetical protein
MNTAGDVLERVKRKIGLLGRRLEDPGLAPTEADEPALMAALQDGLIEIAKKTNRFEGRATVSTAKGQAAYAVTSALDTVRKASIGTRELEHKAGADVRAAAEGPEAKSGRPTCYGLHEGALWLYPVPDGVYEVTLLYKLNGVYGGGGTPSQNAPVWNLADVRTENA